MVWQTRISKSAASLALHPRLLQSRTPSAYLASQRSFSCAKTLDLKVQARSSADSPVERSAAFANIERIHNGLSELRKVLDEHVVGQAGIKEAVMLGLLAREHVYIEGPPGVAKTFLAELVSESTSLEYWFYQMHRDTRLNELIGEAIITKTTSDAGEIIRQDVIQAGILQCELAVLDDISRAPGEALNVLLRILNERKYGSDQKKIPLMTAIATGNPAQEEQYYAEPLDPATLDRFAVQVRAKGHVNQGDWASAAEVIDRYSGPTALDADRKVNAVGREVILEASELVPLVTLGESAKSALLELLRVLKTEFQLGEENALLTDRTFLIKAIKILKANAVLNGRHVCQAEDLRTARYLTTFRVPPKVDDVIDDTIADIIAKHQHA